MRILLVAEKSVARRLQPILEEDNVTVDVVESGDRADFKVLTAEYNVVLVERSLLRGDTYATLMRWRRGGLQAHLLVLLESAAAAAERADCLDAGADAYLLQP